MILRRVIKHVRNQEWTAIIIDLFIVVVGVFIGIQVSNWNDARQHEKSAEIYIQRVRADLLMNQDELRQRTSYFGQTRAHALAVLDALDEPPETLGMQFLIDVYQASQILPRGLGRDTYDEIVSVGANNAISDVAVRTRIATFYTSIKAQISTITGATPYRELIRRGMPYETQSAIRSACDDIVETTASGEATILLPEKCTPELDLDSVTAAVTSILELDIRRDLVRRISDLDAKLVSTQIIVDRSILLDDYLSEIQQ